MRTTSVVLAACVGSMGRSGTVGGGVGPWWIPGRVEGGAVVGWLSRSAALSQQLLCLGGA